jgi:tetratricopeptide (TPR) repeat protein
MSRNKKSRRKGIEQERRRRKLAARRTGMSRSLDVCHRAAELLDRRLFHEARELLEEYEAANPGHRQVLRLLLGIYQEQRDYGPFCAVCRRLVEKEPEDPLLHLMLAGGYLSDARIASALRAFRRFVELRPNDPLADGARESIEQIEPVVDQLLQDLALTGDDRLEFLAMHEEMMACLALGDDTRTVRIGEQLLARGADFIPAINNLSEAYFRTGQADKAVAMSRRLLRAEPDNIHALANLTRYLFLTGRQEEAGASCEQLLSVPSVRGDLWYKKCEALSYLGDDQGVIAVFEDALRAGAAKQRTPATGLLYHLAATAFARQGHHRQAARYWRMALKIQPQLDLARDNLADAACAVGRRHGPWYFPLNYWGCEESLARLCDSLVRSAHRKDDEAAMRAIESFADAHPEVVRLVPALLDRGDAMGREFAWQFAMLLETPEMLDALREFCLSQRGPDAMRMETANRLCRDGVLPSGKVRMWLDGGWRDMQLIGFEITTEPVDANHCPQVDAWLDDGCQALRNGNGREAEELFQKCLDLEGEAPHLLNNLAVSYRLQGRNDESHSLVLRIHEHWPDYFFGRTAMANMATESGNWELAENYLAPLGQRRRLHITEFTALATAHIQLLLARGIVDTARGWLELWRQVDPEHPDLPQVESQFHAAGVLGGLRRLFLGRRR